METLEFLKHCFFAHDHIHATEYKVGQLVETDDEYFIKFVIRARQARKYIPEKKIEKVDIPAENKMLESVPEENKAGLHAVNEAQPKPVTPKQPVKKRTSRKKKKK